MPQADVDRYRAATVLFRLAPSRTVLVHTGVGVAGKIGTIERLKRKIACTDGPYRLSDAVQSTIRGQFWCFIVLLLLIHTLFSQWDSPTYGISIGN